MASVCITYFLADVFIGAFKVAVDVWVINKGRHIKKVFFSGQTTKVRVLLP